MIRQQAITSISYIVLMLCDAFKTNVTDMSSELYNTENGQPQSDMATVIKSRVNAKIEEKRSGTFVESHKRARSHSQ